MRSRSQRLAFPGSQGPLVFSAHSPLLCRARSRVFSGYLCLCRCPSSAVLCRRLLLLCWLVLLPRVCFVPPDKQKGLSWSSQERVQALCKWSNLLTLAPELFSAATVDRLPSKGDEAMIEHLDMLFRKKSTNTLLTRAHPLTRFVLWRRRTCPEDVVSESILWLHCRWLQSCAAASSIDCLVSSLNFVHGTLGLQVAVQELLSARVRGIAHSHLKTKEDVAQAPALTVSQLRWLEYYAATADDLYERLVATLCFMVYARARRSDLARATHIDFDPSPDGLDGFVECRVKNPKHSRASSKRNLFMPLTAPFCGLCDAPWDATFMAVRDANGLQTSGALDHPVLPGLTAAGSWLQECVSSGQLTQWLRCILAKAPDADLAAVTDVRSHSCKATLISWCAKAGLSDKTLTFLGLP